MKNREGLNKSNGVKCHWLNKLEKIKKLKIWKIKKRNWSVASNKIFNKK